MNEQVTIRSRGIKLEGIFWRGCPTRGAVVTHPHPLYGGDMFNPVVEAIACAYQKAGFAVLRFNFRGTGKSAGTHDQGIGEQVDVTAAVDYLKTEGIQQVHLAGYSFGAWVNSMAAHDDMVLDGMTMVAPPVAFINFESGVRLPHLSAVVAGSRDEIAPPDLIQPLLGQWNPDARMEIIDGADHFFFGYLDEVIRRLDQQLQRVV